MSDEEYEPGVILPVEKYFSLADTSSEEMVVFVFSEIFVSHIKLDCSMEIKKRRRRLWITTKCSVSNIRH